MKQVNIKHTVLGAGGSVGNALAYELINTNQKVRLVSRSGFSIKGAETFKADLTSYNETLKSIEGSSVAYLTVGLPYNSKIWEKHWPVIMQNAINACKKHNVKLIFFDNVYMYGKVNGVMTENTPYNPCSKKGEIRTKIAHMLETEMKKDNIQAIIARAADLYGPFGIKTSLPYILIFDKFLKGKKAQWIGTENKKHSFTYIPDAAKGMILLANDNNCINKTWHLPTSNNPTPTVKEFIKIVARNLNIKPGYFILKKWMIKLTGLVNKQISEIYEMMYQYENDYIFDSTRFDNHFNYKPKSYEKGIPETLRYIKNNVKSPE